MPDLKRLTIVAAVAAALTVGSAVAAAPAVATQAHPAAATKLSPVRAWAKQHYGSFTTWKRTGAGDDVLTIPSSIRAAVLTARTSGESNFIVETLTSKNDQDELLVNEIGAYRGTRVFGLESKGTAKRLEITADGPWTVVLKPVYKASALPASGSGDAVGLFSKQAGRMRLTHDGDSNFIVTQHTGGKYGWNLLVNEIGAYSGRVPTDGGPSVVEIEADGGWTTRYQR